MTQAQQGRGGQGRLLRRKRGLGGGVRLHQGKSKRKGIHTGGTTRGSEEGPWEPQEGKVCRERKKRLERPIGVRFQYNGESLKGHKQKETRRAFHTSEQRHSCWNEWKDVEVSTALRGLSSSDAGKKRYWGGEVN